MKRISVLVMTALLAMSGRAAPKSEESLLEIAGDPQAGVVERTRAFADLRAVAGERAVPMLVALLPDPAWSFSARSVLEVMPGPVAGQALLGALESAGDDTLRTGLVNSLGNRRDARAVPALAKFLASADATLAGAALNALGNIGTPQAADALAAFQPSQATRTAWADALLRVAEALPSSESTKAIELYRRVVATADPSQVAAATMGRARRSDEPVRAVVAALASDERALRQAALSLIRAGEFGGELVEAAGHALPLLRPEVQVQVLSVLYDRGDRRAAAVARHALTAGDSSVRAAAANLLSTVGDASDAPALLRMMTGGEEPALSARRALARIPGEETAALLLEAFRQGGEARAAALQVLVSRGYRPLVTELLRPDIHADQAMGRTAANAILVLGTATDLPAVLALYGQLPPDQRGALQGALRRLASKHPSPDEAASLVVAAAEALPPEEGEPLFVILAGIGGEGAFASAACILKSSSAELRKLALRVLGQWRDIRPATTILDVARADSDPAVRALAIRSATAVIGKSAFEGAGTPVPERVPAAIEGLRQTWQLAEMPEARNAIVAALKRMKDPAAIAAAEELEKQTAPAK